jgi:hypothetical protein
MFDNAVVVGWLLDEGKLCVGGSRCGGFDWVTYTDPNAIRFATKRDAETMRFALGSEPGGKYSVMSQRAKPVEHQWG